MAEWKRLIITVTGHRPNRLNNEWNLQGPMSQAISWELSKYFGKLLEDNIEPFVITGMAPGFDQLVALFCIVNDIKFIAAVPFEGQENRWSPSAIKLYKEILGKAAKVHLVSEGGYANHKYITRDYWMVDKGDKILACWDGSASGTGTTVNYAKKKNKPIYIIDPRDLI